jgi:hypothetical protein
MIFPLEEMLMRPSELSKDFNILKPMVKFVLSTGNLAKELLDPTLLKLKVF